MTQWDHVPAWAAEFPNDNPLLHEGVSWVCLAVRGPVKPITRPRAGAVRALQDPWSLRGAPREPAVTAAEVAPEAVPPPVEEALPESVLTVLLERLELDLTPSAASAEDVLDIDASDLEAGTSASPPAMGEPLPALDAAPVDFDGAIDDGAPAALLAEEPEVPAAPLAEEPEAPAAAVAEEPEVPAAAVAEEPDAHAAFVEALVAVLLASGATRAAAVLPTLLDAGSADETLLDADSIRDLASGKMIDQSSGRIHLTPAFVATASAWRAVLRGQSNDLSACGTSTLDGWAADLLKALGVGREGRVDVRRELRRRGVAAFGMLRAA